MANIQSTFQVVHADSGLNLQSAVIRASSESAFTPIAVTIGDVDETLNLGDVSVPKDVYIKFLSGDPLYIGFSEGVYPLALEDSKEWLKLRLNTGVSPTVHLLSGGSTDAVIVVAPA